MAMPLDALHDGGVWRLAVTRAAENRVEREHAAVHDDGAVAAGSKPSPSRSLWNFLGLATRLVVAGLAASRFGPSRSDEREDLLLQVDAGPLGPFRTGLAVPPQRPTAQAPCGTSS